MMILLIKLSVTKLERNQYKNSIYKGVWGEMQLFCGRI